MYVYIYISMHLACIFACVCLQMYSCTSTEYGRIYKYMEMRKCRYIHVCVWVFYRLYKAQIAWCMRMPVYVRACESITTY